MEAVHALRRAPLLALVAVLSAAPAALAQTPAKPPPTPSPSTQSSATPAAPRSAEQQRQDAERQAQGEVNQDATAVISETRAALDAIARKDKAGAIAALERATGKVNILLARNPSTALVPESVEVLLIDTAPTDRTTITSQTDAVLAAINRRDYALARVLLDSLRSEIRIRTSNVPLATYPAALREAARLLEAGENEDAGLASQIATLESQLQRNQNASAAFAKLQADLGVLSREQSKAQRRGRATG